jgi:putative ABC transport system permease protein
MFLTDLVYTLRALAARPAFAATAVATLALGLGANTAMFSVIRTVLLEPLPYTAPEELIRIVGFDRATAVRNNLSPADFLDFQRDARSFARMGAHGSVGFATVADARGESERVGSVNVTEGFFPTLGANFVLGRPFTEEEDRAGAVRTAVLGHAFWRRRFGADPTIVGRTVTVNMQPTTIVGVLDDRYRHLESNAEREADVFLPFGWNADEPNRSARFIRAVARLRPGERLEHGRAELTAIAIRLEQQYPRDNTERGVLLQPLHHAIVENARPALLTLAAAVAFVLLIACANLTNLLLAQGAVRRGELAVRTALGASRWRLVRQLMTESVTLSAIGAAAGLALAFAALPWLTRLGAAGVPGAADIDIDGSVLTFTSAATLITGLVIGLLPAWQLSGDLHVAISHSSRGRSHVSMQRWSRELLIAGQVALALVLLVGAGLMLRSLWRLQQVDTGFRTEQVLTFETAVPTATYEEGEQILFYDQYYERLRALPGVAAVGAINILPLSANYDSRGVQIDAHPVSPERAHAIQARSIAPGYFDAMDIPVLAGRAFDARDREQSPLVVVVSAAMARKYWPGESAVGQRLTFNNGIPLEQQQEIGGPGSREVVGVVGDVKHLGLDEGEVPMFYTPQAQQPSYHTMAVVVRAAGDAAALTSAVRRELAAIDRTVPLYRVRTLEAMVRTVTAEPRMRTSLIVLFALIAITLAAVGVYGVVGYVVGQRQQEIAVRLALGAERRSVLAWIAWEGLRPVSVGLSIGLLCAIAGTRVVSGLLFGVTATDVPTYASVIGLLLTMAGVAVMLPARRAARVDPMTALRSE